MDEGKKALYEIFLTYNSGQITFGKYSNETRGREVHTIKRRKDAMEDKQALQGRRIPYSCSSRALDAWIIRGVHGGGGRLPTIEVKEREVGDDTAFMDCSLTHKYEAVYNNLRGL